MPKEKPKRSFFQPIFTFIWVCFWKGCIFFLRPLGLYNSVWKIGYIWFAFIYRTGVARLGFMNYGYATSNEEEEEKLLRVARKPLETEDPRDRNHILMYEKTLSLCPLYPDFEGKELVEMGPGHGGGIKWMCKAHPELKSIKGVDRTVVDSLDGKIIHGDALNSPMENESVDLVLNVEASHCYDSQPKYVAEVMRILRPGGYHILADMRTVEPIGPLESMDWTFANLCKDSKEAGLELIDSENITANILRSIDDLEERMKQVTEAKWYTRLVQLLWHNWWALPGTSMHHDFSENIINYYVACWRKPILEK